MKDKLREAKAKSERLVWEFGGLLIEHPLTQRLGLYLSESVGESVAQKAGRELLNLYTSRRLRPRSHSEHAPF